MVLGHTRAQVQPLVAGAVFARQRLHLGPGRPGVLASGFQLPQPAVADRARAVQHAQQVARQAVGLRPVQRIELRLRVGQQGQRLLGLVEAGHARLVGEHGQRQGQRGAAQRHRAPLLGLGPR